MERLIYDGAPEQIGRKMEFQRIMRKYDIRGHVAESGRSKQNPVKDALENFKDDGSVPCSNPTFHNLYGAMGSHTLKISCKSQHRSLQIYKAELHSKP